MMLHAISLESTGCNDAAPFSYRTLQDATELQLSGTSPDTAYKGQWVLTGSYHVKHFFLMCESHAIYLVI